MIDSGAGDDACTFAPKVEDGAMTEEGGGNACNGLRAGADEQATPDTVTVVVESNRTVLTPSGPVELKVDVLFDAPGLGVAVDTGEIDDEAAGVPEEDKVVLEGTIPPKLNVLVGAKELNWRLFRLMTDGGAPGALRLMTDGEGDADGLRLMTGGGTCGPAIRPTSEGLGCVGEGLFKRMTLDDGVGFMPSGEITPSCIS